MIFWENYKNPKGAPNHKMGRSVGIFKISVFRPTGNRFLLNENSTLMKCAGTYLKNFIPNSKLSPPNTNCVLPLPKNTATFVGIKSNSRLFSKLNI